MRCAFCLTHRACIRQSAERRGIVEEFGMKGANIEEVLEPFADDEITLNYVVHPLAYAWHLASLRIWREKDDER